ncbi:hypothetical protein DITRI_Ditri03aG0106100 [Diplodiscus trichospermus]
MWIFASKAFTGANRMKTDSSSSKPSQVSSEYSDDDTSLSNSGDERLECPICWESFNIVENIPYVLWCGHTLCKNCVLGLQRAVLKFPTLPIPLPFFISCPWCNLFSLRLVYKGNVKFPSKNYFLLWMVESMNGDRSKSNSSFRGSHPPACSTNRTIDGGNQPRHRRASCTTHHSEHSESSHDQGRLVTSCFSAERLQSSLLQDEKWSKLATPVSLKMLLRQTLVHKCSGTAILCCSNVVYQIFMALCFSKTRKGKRTHLEPEF